MKTLILIGSIIGILNSFILIFYALTTKKGNRNVNLLFALFIFMLTLRISKSILLTFSDGLHDLLLTLGLSGFMAIGPTFLFFSKAVINSKFKINKKLFIHFLPAIVFTFMWVFLEQIRSNGSVWHIFYRTILLQYMIYLSFAIFIINNNSSINSKVKKQLNIISVFLLVIWFAYLLNEVAGFPYISGAILYSILIYFSLIIILNKGHIIDMASPKYNKTGLVPSENNRVLNELNILFEDKKIYTDNLISLSRLANLLNTSTHILSQIINDNKQKTFFELIRYYRIMEAKRLLFKSDELKVSAIAFDVGYNSLSAFNNAFKKTTGLTPSKYRNEKVNS